MTNQATTSTSQQRRNAIRFTQRFRGQEFSALDIVTRELSCSESFKDIVCDGYSPTIRKDVLDHLDGRLIDQYIVCFNKTCEELGFTQRAFTGATN